MNSQTSNEAAKDEFDISDEYVHQLYRLFIMYLGMSVFPLIGLLSLLGSLIEYPLDKLRMLRVCQRPKRLESSMKNFTILFLFGTAVAALLV